MEASAFYGAGFATFSMPISRMSNTPDSGMPSMGLPSESDNPQSFLCTFVPEGNDVRGSVYGSWYVLRGDKVIRQMLHHFEGVVIFFTKR